MSAGEPHVPTNFKASHWDLIQLLGSFLTPQVLELSGIGDSARLKSLNIKSVVDLPGVGENYQDHSECTSDFQLLDPSTITLGYCDQTANE